MNSLYFNYLYILLAAILLTACGGGGGGGANSDNETLTGVFVDSPVEGLRWVSGDMAGTTDAAGTFQYKSGATVQFYVGDVLVGEATGDSVLIPVDLVASAQDLTNPTVTNIIRFLITLDNDNDPSNGIEITEASANLALGEAVNFAQSTSDFAASGDIQVLISTLTSATSAGARLLVSVSVAQTHAENSIKGLLAGAYSGTFGGDRSGSWTGTISTSGVYRGTATSSSSETVSMAGLVNTKGSGLTDFETSGGASDGTTFSGTFKPNGTGSGTWNYFGLETGTWGGSKTN
jgi:hypothetical protein